MMEYTFTLPGAFAVFIAGCGAIITISNAIKAVAAWRDAVKKPDADQDKKLEDLDHRMTKVEKKLDNDAARFEAIEAGNRVTQKALLALLAHGIDGNEVDAMREAKAELQKFLINK